MNALRSLVALAFVGLAVLAPCASAQQFNTPGGGVVIGAVPMCLDPNGKAVTCGTPVIGVGAGTTGAVVGTLAAVAGKTTSICGFDVSAIGGTAAVGPIVIAGLIGGSFTYQMSSSAAGNTLSRTFSPCIPASAANTPITVTTTADGTASAVDVNSWGFAQ